MRVLVLGATGSIGTAVSAELNAHNHKVIALVRSEENKSKLEARGYETISGDLRQPEKWSNIVHSVDAIVQVATTFTDDMGMVDRVVIEALQKQASSCSRPLRFVYTGGCWLYGATNDTIATEETPFNPITPFAWAIDNAQLLLASSAFNTVIVHPAMVYHSEGGVFSRFIEQASTQHPIEVWGNQHVRWPLIHRDDLAVAYRLLLERGDLRGNYNASSEVGVRVGKITTEIAKQFNNSLPLIEIAKNEIVARYGAWAEGPTLDQQMSADKLKTDTNWAPRWLSFADVKFVKTA